MEEVKVSLQKVMDLIDAEENKTRKAYEEKTITVREYAQIEMFCRRLEAQLADLV